MKKRLHAIFSGQVQGVGFRFTTESLALDFGCTGWVKNLRSGEVEVVAEAEEEALSKLLDRLKEEFRGYISDCKLIWEDCKDEFKGFGINL